jgi:putative transposase
MKISQFSKNQIIAILKEHKSGASVAELCRKYGTTTNSKDKVRLVEDENRRLKRLLADAMLENAKLRGLVPRSSTPHR